MVWFGVLTLVFEGFSGFLKVFRRQIGKVYIKPSLPRLKKMVNWETITSTAISSVIVAGFALVTGILKFNSNFTKLGDKVENLGKEMGEMKTEMKERDEKIEKTLKERNEKIDKKFDEVKGEIKEIKTNIEKRDEKIDKKFDEVKGDIKDLRTEITGRKVIESFDGIRTDIRYIKEGFARSEERSRKKLRSRGKAGSSAAKEKAKAKQVNARRALISSAGFESLEESVKRRSGQKSAAIA